MLLLLGCFALTGCQNVQEQEETANIQEEEMSVEEEDEFVFAVNVDSSVSESYVECVWMNRSKFWGSLVFQGLLIADGNITNVRPELCEEYITSPDGTKYVFLLRDDVYWHDGKKLTTDIYHLEDDIEYGTVSTIKLAKDEYFVLGDNRNISNDSRSIGPIKSSSIDGVIINKRCL